MHFCKGIHDRFAAPMGKRNYKMSKRCSLCSLFVSWDGNHCPCCGYVLRYSRRTERWKKEAQYKRI